VPSVAADFFPKCFLSGGQVKQMQDNIQSSADNDFTTFAENVLVRIVFAAEVFVRSICIRITKILEFFSIVFV
jgi:hypothetical protein